WADGQVRIQPTNKGGVLPQGEWRITPKDPKGEDQGAFQASNLITGEARGTEYFVFLVAATEQPLPQPVVVRSRHAQGPECEKKRQFPVWRFFFEPNAKLDQSKVVRKVLPITIGKAD